jgi:hypothetical protein
VQQAVAQLGTPIFIIKIRMLWKNWVVKRHPDLFR